jgi:SAM-dependent methyltransferase
MSGQIKFDRWLQAQASEKIYWDTLNVSELLRICAEKPPFLDLLGANELSELFDRKDVLEIGCGPLGVALASFYPFKYRINHLHKIEPLPRLVIKETAAASEEWASQFVSWVDILSNEGMYLQKPGEDIRFSNEYDTVITYNVLDHVHTPEKIIATAFEALRSHGKILIGVDCLSVLGRLKFELLTRNTMKGTVLVEAHPHTFIPRHVLKLLNDTGFKNVHCVGAPSKLKQFMGSHYRPAFIGTKP